VLGKSLTKLNVTDYVFTFVSTRSLRQSVVTTMVRAVVVAPAPVHSDPATFRVYDQEGNYVFSYELQSQACAPGSRRQLIRSNNPNDLIFAYLCQSEDLKNTTLGQYRFEVEDDKETKLKKVVVAQNWVLDLGQAGIEGRIESAIFTRSMSARVKLVVATADRFAIVSSIAGAVERVESLEDDLRASPKLMAVATGFSITSKNKIVVKKLTSSGVVDETYKPCTSI